MNKIIDKAITNIRLNAERYAKAGRYYNGQHDLSFASEKFQNTFGSLFREFALNLCPVICDAVRDKLRVTGFSVEDTGGNATVRKRAREGEGTLVHTRVSALVASHARRIWQQNRMGTRVGEIHKEALIYGDAYMIVWPDEYGAATFYPNKAANITVAMDEASPGSVAWAAKVWRTADKHVRLNLFYPDRIEKFISRKEVEGGLPDADGFAPLTASSNLKVQGSKSSIETWNLELGTLNREPWTVPNPYGIVPVFHFANNADLGALGRSELESAMPVQDGLNKSVLDMLVAMEFAAYRQRWAAGIEIKIDENGKAIAPFKAGIDHIWISENPGARFGDFEATELEQFLKVKDSFRVDMASVTGTPLHYFLQHSGDFPSGASLKKAETRFLAKVRDRHESFGQVWADAMSFALMIEGKGSDTRLITEWEDPAPMAEREFLENILLKKQIGLPVEQALLEAGYGAADVKAMVKGSGVE
ncbi:MAG: phage portal protein [Chloracidobacterium sp.]|nr:phage portal protein [Chloracidobacterium sp.]